MSEMNGRFVRNKHLSGRVAKANSSLSTIGVDLRKGRAIALEKT